MKPPLVIACHGTRIPAGVTASHDLAALLRERLPGVPVSVGFVELAAPSVDDAVADALRDASDVVVVPLMVGTGVHVRRDIPASIARAATGRPAAVHYSAHLGAHPALVEALRQRVDAARGDWSPDETVVVCVGRGSLVGQANADHAGLARLLWERGGYADVVPGWIQVTTPSLPEALDRAYALGARRIVVAANFLFPGRLSQWLEGQSGEWAVAHEDAQVRVADVLGPCPELAEVVALRYAEASAAIPSAPASAAPAPADEATAAAAAAAEVDPEQGVGSSHYLAGLDLRGRRVVVVGAGRVSERRVPRLVAAGADVTLIAPRATPGLRDLAASGAVRWVERGFVESDLDGAWYAMAATDDAEVNAAVSAGAETRRLWCVRADRARAGTAWTPAVTEAGGFTVATLGHGDCLASRRVRDALVSALGDGPGQSG